MKDLEDRLEEETTKHVTFKAQLQGKVNGLRMEVSQRQKEYADSQQSQLTKNKALLRDNTRLKNEVRMLREEMGLKPVPDPIINDYYDNEDDFAHPPQSVKSLPTRPESAKGGRTSFGQGHNRSVASSKNNLRSEHQ